MTSGRLLAIILLALVLVAPAALTGCSEGSSASATAVPSPSPSAAPPSPTPTSPPTATPTPTPQLTSCGPAATEVLHGDPDRPLVALTFDTGSDDGYTLQILETLRNEKITATFAITGHWARRYPDLLQAIVADGHPLMNHSEDHPSFTGLSTHTGPLTREERISQLEQAEEVVKALTGVSTKPYFRPPYGDVDGSVLCDVYAAGYSYVIMWSVDTAGWNHATAEQILQTVLERAHSGAIYIMHVGSQSADAAALPQMIQGLRAKGYQFGTVADVLP